MMFPSLLIPYALIMATSLWVGKTEFQIMVSLPCNKVNVYPSVQMVKVSTRPLNAIHEINEINQFSDMRPSPSTGQNGGSAQVSSALGNHSPADLASLAPIVMVMYCFNQAPQLTMMMLTGLMMYILGSGQ